MAINACFAQTRQENIDELITDYGRYEKCNDSLLEMDGGQQLYKKISALQMYNEELLVLEIPSTGQASC